MNIKLKFAESSLRQFNVFKYSDVNNVLRICVARWAVFSVGLFVCGCVCLSACKRDNSIAPFSDIIMKYLWEQDMAKSSDEIENGCI